MFRWMQVYGFDDKSDKQGRWGYMCLYNHLNICTITKVEHNGITKYQTNENFPRSSSYHMPTRNGSYDTLGLAMRDVEKHFLNFIGYNTMIYSILKYDSGQNKIK